VARHDFEEEQMKTSKRFWVGAAVLAMTLAAAVPMMASAGVGQVVKISTTLQISPYAYFGYVKASNPNCIEERTVVLKQKGHGVLSRGTSNEKGKWEVDAEEMNKNFKGPLPYKLYAEAKPVSQGTAGTIYKCLAATSKTITISGG
jgi:hypothetical protein